MIYYPTNLSPSNISIDATQSITFSYDYNGDDVDETQAYYQLSISTLDNSWSYNPTQQAFTGTGTINIVVPANTLSNGNQYKWCITVWSSAGNQIASLYSVFNAIANATATLDSLPSGNVITSQFYTFSMTYNINRNVNVKYYRFILYDATGSEVVKDSGLMTPIDISSSKYDYMITGMVNEKHYQIQGIIYTQDDEVATTDKIAFTTEYTIPLDEPTLTIDQDCQLGMNVFKWNNIFQVVGTLRSGNTPTYVSGKYNQALHISSNDALIYSDLFSINKLQTKIPNDFELTYYIKLPSNFSGDFLKFDSQYFIGYDSTSQKFYYKNPYRYTSGKKRTLPTDWFLLGVSNNQIIIEYNGDIEIIE